MSARKKKQSARRSSSTDSSSNNSEIKYLRIIGGKLGGRKLVYHGDRRTRPMKERVREAIFNLIGPSIKGKHAVDLFAGTGALGLESLSRGAVSATFIEQHYPTAKVLQENILSLDVQSITTLHTANTFLWLRKTPDFGELPCVVFISPPYDFYVDRLPDMIAMIEDLISKLPPDSVIIVESDDRLETEQLPEVQQWDIRTYHPAIVAMRRI